MFSLIRRALNKPRVVFKYKSPDGRAFISGRGVTQKSRAAGGFDIHTNQPATYFDREESPEKIVVEVDRADFNASVRLKEGLAESFTLMFSIRVSNRSQEVVLVRDVRPTLEVPDGYQQHSFFNDFNYPNGRNLNVHFPPFFGQSSKR